MGQITIPCMQIRGGTSKGAYILASDLPSDSALRDRVLMSVMGSPDKRQIDGIGGGDSLTSKVAIVRPSAREDADVDYLFAQVLVEEARVDYGQNCGNILAGIAPFAIERGLVPLTGPITSVRIFMENTQQIAVAHVQTPNGTIEYAGDTRIDGVPGAASPIVVEFNDIAGSTCGALLPTGNSSDWIDGIEVTCIDNGMPVVLLRAEDLGRTGYESCDDLNSDEALKSVIESIRLQAGSLMNLGDVSSRNVPKMCIVAQPRSGGTVCTRTFIPHRCHASIGVFGAVSVATACVVKGSVAQSVAEVGQEGALRLSIEHPSGEFSVEAHVMDGAIKACGLIRTARPVFDGNVLIPKNIWPERNAKAAARFS